MSADGEGGGKPARTTIFMTEALSFNLDLFALKSGKPKGEIVREAVTQYLEKAGLEPERKPATLTYSYE